MTEGEAAVDGRKHGSIEVPAKKWKKRDMEKMAPRTEEQLKSKLDKAGGMTLELVAKDGNGKTIKAMPLEMKHFGTGSVGYTISESLHLTLKTGEDEEGQPLSLFCTSNCTVIGSKPKESEGGEGSRSAGKKRSKKDAKEVVNDDDDDDN